MAAFVWRVSKLGYEWRPASEVLDRVAAGLPDVLATGFEKGAREYHPLTEEPSLFCHFAELANDPLSYIAFANKYGHLTAGVTVIDKDGYGLENEFADQIRWPNGKQESSWLSTEIESEAGVETKGVWFNHTVQMRSMIRLWERSKKKRGRISEGELGKTIIGNLWHRVVPCFEESGALSLAPVDLLSALWLQFAQAVGGGQVHRQCPNCRTWFQVAVPNAQGRRTREDKKYCGDACRMQAAYDRSSRRRTKRRGAAG